MRKWMVLVVCLCIGVSISSHGDNIVSSHNCSEPYKPYEFTDQSEYDRFLGEVENYRRCLVDFAAEQMRLAKIHSRAAEEAVDDWNYYANNELP